MNIVNFVKKHLTTPLRGRRLGVVVGVIALSLVLSGGAVYATEFDIDMNTQWFLGEGEAVSPDGACWNAIDNSIARAEFQQQKANNQLYCDLLDGVWMENAPSEYEGYDGYWASPDGEVETKVTVDHYAGSLEATTAARCGECEDTGIFSPNWECSSWVRHQSFCTGFASPSPSPTP